MIQICKWKYNADSPVMFMIDDLCNSWVDINNNMKIDLGEDFGAGMYSENSSFRFLEEKILKEFPWVKVNFYVPVGKRIGMLLNSPIKMYSAPINANEEVKNFFRNIHKNSKYELCYHGITHGRVYNDVKDQKQEWECFSTLEEAIKTIEIGKNIFKDVTGEFPRGGKYCGYTRGEYGDKSIDESNFFWWHRFWNKGIEGASYSEKFSGKERNPLIAYDISEFGRNKVIDIPSTVNGGIFSLKSKSKLKEFIKRIFKKFFLKSKEKQIYFLLKNKLVISIQEHISPARDDGKIQTPNIFDDIYSLKRIFKYLEDKNVWYCTGTELAEYYYLRKYIRIMLRDNYLEFDMSNITREIKHNKISLKIKQNAIGIVSPEGKYYKIENNIVTVPVTKGKYLIVYERKDNE